MTGNNTAEIKNKIQSVLKRAAAVTIIMLIIDVIVLQVLNSQIQSITKLKKSVVQLQVESESITQTKAFLTSQKQNIEAFSKVVPDQSDFIQFVQTMEEIAQDFAISHELNFVSSTPVREKDYLYIPLTMRFNIHSSQVIPFLRRFERIPYLVQVTNFEIKNYNSLENVSVNIKAKIYVQNPFTL